MEIEVGEYVRNNKGNIGKVIGIFDGHCTAKYHIEFQGNVKVKRQYLSTNTIVNHNKIISEIVEVGDYVNGKEVIEVREQEGKIYLMTGYVPQSYIKEDIKSIVTHEQFESIEYKVEEE